MFEEKRSGVRPSRGFREGATTELDITIPVVFMIGGLSNFSTSPRCFASFTAEATLNPHQTVPSGHVSSRGALLRTPPCTKPLMLGIVMAPSRKPRVRSAPPGFIHVDTTTPLEITVGSKLKCPFFVAHDMSGFS